MSRRILAPVLLLVVLCVVALPLTLVQGQQEYRTFDGSGNNKLNTNWGKAGTPYLRASKNSYADGLQAMRTDLPSARNITATLRGITFLNPSNRLPRSDLLTYWGQFLAHDVLFAKSNSAEPSYIQVPKGDIYFDPLGTGTVTIPFARSLIDAAATAAAGGVRQQTNFITSYLDGSVVYGSDTVRATALRSLQGGKLKTTTLYNSATQSSETFLPKNVDNLENENPSRIVSNQELFVAGDIRCNENPVLATLHTIFLREHNRLCDELARANPSWNDERLYQEARRFVAAYIQAISFNEYVTAILGAPLPSYKGYNSSINASIRSIFSGAAFRYGHTEVNSNLWRLDEQRREWAGKHLLLRENLFNPEWHTTGGVDPIIRGSLEQRQQEVDLFFVSDLQNFLFGRSPAHGALDLSAININRGRDFGLPLLNDARSELGLPRYTSFTQLTTNTAIQDVLKYLYRDNIDLVELYIGGLAEDHIGIANVGPTFAAIITEQYIALRDGDRFFYKNRDTSGFTDAQIAEIEQTTLTRIILRNTNITAMQCAAFWLPTSSTYDCKSGSTVSSADSLKTTTATLLGGSYQLSWSLVGIDSVDITVTAKTLGWVGIGFSSGSLPSMVSADIIIGSLGSNGATSTVDDYYVTGRSADCSSGSGSAGGAVCKDTQLTGGKSDIYNALVTRSLVDGTTTMKFSRKLVTGDSKYDVDITNRDIPVIVAFGSSDTIGYHGANKGAVTINFFTSTISNDVYNARVAHGVIMFLAWWVFLAFGIFAARFTKQILGPFFLQAHLFFQIVGMALVVAGFAVAVMMTPTGSHFSHPHAIFGIITFVLAVLQAGLGETTNIMFKKTQKFGPITFSPLEIMHWVLGYFLMILSIVTIYLGFYRFGNVHVAIWVLFAVWVIGLFAVWLFLHVIPQLRPVSRVTVPDSVGEALAQLVKGKNAAEPAAPAPKPAEAPSTNNL